jgi:probable rRNA maturation factor
VAVQYAVPRSGVPGAASLRKWLAAVPGFDNVVLRIVGRAEGRRLNRTFRKKDYPTNVLSFSYGNGRGDIILCHSVVAREAREQGKSLAAHYAHLVVHGMLHLRGLDHGDRASAGRMEGEEIRILRRLGFSDPYALK